MRFAFPVLSLCVSLVFGLPAQSEQSSNDSWVEFEKRCLGPVTRGTDIRVDGLRPDLSDNDHTKAGWKVWRPESGEWFLVSGEGPDFVFFCIMLEARVGACLLYTSPSPRDS